MKLKSILFVLGVFFYGYSSSSLASTPFFSRSSSLLQDNPPKKEKIIENPDINPMYPGGMAAMTRFIASQLRYPRKCVENNEQGLVVYNFVVETDGSLSNFELLHRADPLLNEEALRIIKLMPAWRPAKYKGKFVRARHFVPMYFRLNKQAALAQRRTGKGVGISKQKKAISDTHTEIETALKDNEVYSIVDQMPQFPSGEAGMHRFIGKFMEYPSDAHQAGIQGRILCAFIVDKEGAISHIEIIKGLYPSLDNESMRVISIMPRWKPGMNNGKRVNVKCVLPFDFTIDETPISPLPVDNGN